MAKEILKENRLPESDEMIYYISGVDPRPDGFEKFLEADGIPHFMHQFKRAKDERYQAIGLARQIIQVGLTSTLQGSANAQYGRAENQIDIAPYVAANTPSKARYGEAFELVPYYIQDYLQTGVREEQAVEYIQTITATIQEEMRAKLIEEGDLPAADQTATYQAFYNQFGINPIELRGSPKAIEEFRKQINNSNQTKLDFLKQWVFPNVLMAAQQVSSNPHDLVELFSVFGGFSGTPWNAKTYAKSIDISNAQTPGTDGKTVALLKKKAQEGELKIHILPTEQLRDPIKGITDHLPEFFNRYNVFIDLNGDLKGITNYEAAVKFEQKALERQRQAQAARRPVSEDAIMAVGFVDERYKRKVIKQFRRNELQPLVARPDIAPKRRLFIYDQANCVGTDVVQDPKARALVTIGKNMSFKMFQALWRMRQLDKGQNVDFIMSSDTEELIRSTLTLAANEAITIDHIILFTALNQIDRVAEDILNSDRRNMLVIAQHAMTRQLIAAASDPTLANPDVRATLYRVFEKHLLKLMRDDFDSFASVDRMEESPVVLEAYRKELLSRFAKVAKELAAERVPHEFQQRFANALKELADFKIASKDDLPKHSRLACQEKGSQVEMQQQQQQQISMQIQSETHDRANQGQDWNDWIGSYSFTHQNFSDAASNSIFYLPTLVPEISKEIKISPNLATTRSAIEKQKGHPPLLMFLVFKDNNGQWRSAFVDQNDYDRYFANYKWKASDQVAIYDLRSERKRLILRGSGPNEQEPWASAADKEKALELIVQAKLMAGHIYAFDKDEKAALEKWMAHHPNKKAFMKFYENSCLDPLRQEEYQRSPLCVMAQA